MSGRLSASTGSRTSTPSQPPTRSHAREARRLPRPVLELAGMAMEGWAKLRGKPPAFTARAATFIDRRGTVSVAKAHEQLGWEPGVPYEEGMHRTEKWLRAEGLI